MATEKKSATSTLRKQLKEIQERRSKCVCVCVCVYVCQSLLRLQVVRAKNCDGPICVCVCVCAHLRLRACVRVHPLL